MSKSLLTFLLKRAFQEAVKKANGNSNADVFPSSRREFFQKSALGLGLIGGIGNASESLKTNSFFERWWAGVKDDPYLSSINKPKIAIIGAGMAGLNFSYQLQKAGFKSTVYESSSRVGGRMFTVRDIFGKGITTDLGGEWVDDGHEDIKNLCKEFNIDLYDIRKKELLHHTYYFEGKILSQEDIYNALVPYVSVFKKDLDRMPEEITRENVGLLTDLDNMSILQYLDKAGVKGWLYRFLIIAMESEYGAEVSDQSALNLLVILHMPSNIGELDDFEGKGAEVMKIKGGSQHLSNAIYEKVKSQVIVNHALTHIDSQGNGYSISLKNGEKLQKVYADYLVLALPFSRLRKVVLNIPLPETKKRAIHQLAYGNSAKFILGFSGKPWVQKGHIGKLTTDLPIHTGWDSTLMQSETEASYTIFSGGKLSKTIRDTSNAILTKQFLSYFEQVYAGMKKAFTGNVRKFIWETYPHTLGAYSYYRVGHWTTIGGHESDNIGQLFFAGEHCSLSWQGYMNGAALSARLASEKLIMDVGQKHFEKQTPIKLD